MYIFGMYALYLQVLMQEITFSAHRVRMYMMLFAVGVSLFHGVSQEFFFLSIKDTLTAGIPLQLASAFACTC